ncbi:MAG: penicillin-binding protein 2 [Patescibacteria group bacterium]|nr:penicillin-binding protein 2 [Patescibacteria group bacterium]MDE2015821.1 penicillin-binding protein 2 [Patescibacteria group bacterium]MDE2227196.1 penicillin-binding protein 2 [Patescibacteria group bacterium]
MLFKSDKNKDLAFEDSLGDDWENDLGIVEISIGNKPLVYLGAVIIIAGLLLAITIFYLNFGNGKFYSARAEANVNDEQRTPAPRGLIVDREGDVLAKNEPVFSAILNIKTFLQNDVSREDILRDIENILYISPNDILGSIDKNGATGNYTGIALSDNLTQNQLIQLRALNSPAISIQNDFERRYINGPIFSSVVGYIGRASPANLKNNPDLSAEDFVGKAGVESFYDSELSGTPGIMVTAKNASGQVLSEEKKNDPQIGETLSLTIDGELQKYFYARMQSGLASLGRTKGAGLAIDPQNGEVLALVNFPSFDNNILSGSGNNSAKLAILNSSDKPLFNRIVSGFYNPGSTIKPLVGVAALKEGIIDPQRQIFSPGYLDVPNPYNPQTPTRYLDWRYQGNVNLAAALAQSSNVYFYTVGGGANTQILLASGSTQNTGHIDGLGISTLSDWWRRFHLGEKTGIDLTGEAAGFLPSASWKEQKTGTPWLLGDTYNVSIGQGDLLLTPLQLLDYISAIANGGTIYKPVVNMNAPHPQVLADLTDLLPEIKEAQKGMIQAVTAPLGTAYSLHDLGFPVAAKTGSAQVQNNAQENAFFVGYTPTANPQIAILILIENSKEGSLNAVPIAKDVLNWYYLNRIKK